MSRRGLTAVLAALVVTLVLAGCGDASEPSDTAANRFLSRYATGDGRVLRRDQGGDIVSEGQAYGMLIAELAGRPGTVRTIWNWTRTHLQRSDHLLSWHADGSGKVLDVQAATDADTLAAYALLRYRGPDGPRLHQQGRAIAKAVLAEETVTTPSGGIVPVAGPWATTQSPATVDPSYWMPGVYLALARLTGDRRWSSAAATTVGLVNQGTGYGSVLPSDWGQLSGSSMQATGTADGPTQYGPDAQRVPLWFAYGCDTAARKLAAAWWGKLRYQPDATVLGTDDSVIDGDPSPLAMLASAASAQAAGDRSRAASLRRQAARQARRVPTYYGDAWVALSAGLADGRLVSCH